MAVRPGLQGHGAGNRDVRAAGDRGQAAARRPPGAALVHVERHRSSGMPPATASSTRRKVFGRIDAGGGGDHGGGGAEAADRDGARYWTSEAMCHDNLGICHAERRFAAISGDGESQGIPVNPAAQRRVALRIGGSPNGNPDTATDQDDRPATQDRARPLFRPIETKNAVMGQHLIRDWAATMTDLIYRAAKQSDADPFEYVHVRRDASTAWARSSRPMAGILPTSEGARRRSGCSTTTPNAIIGRWENVRVEGKRLLARLVFAKEGTSELADEVRSHCGNRKSCAAPRSASGR